MTTGADPGTPTWLGARNDRTAFRLLIEHGPLSRSQLGELSGMSKPTAGQMIARLERAGLIGPAGETAGARGPSAVVYGVRRTAMTGVAISILADAIQAVVADPLGSDHPVATIPVTGLERSPEADVARAVEAACAAADVDPSSVTLLAIGVQAAVDEAADQLSFTDTLPGWPQTGARRRIEAATGATVILDNDVNLAAIAERASGAVDGVSSFVYLWLGEGLGVGIDVDGAIQRGTTGGAGEIGYLEVPRSAAAIDAAAVDLTDLLGRIAMVRILGGEPGSALADVLPERLDEATVAEVAPRVALAIAPILALIDPGAVVLGGATGIAGGALLSERVQQIVDAAAGPDRGLARAQAHTLVRPAAVDTQPVLVGAGRLLVDRIRARLDASISA